MSSIEKARFTARTGIPAARITLFDHFDRKVATNWRELSLELQPGLYTVRTEVNGRIADQIIRHEMRGTELPDVPVNMPYSSTPALDMSEANRPYRKFAIRCARSEPQVQIGEGGGNLFLMLRPSSKTAFDTWVMNELSQLAQLFSIWQNDKELHFLQEDEVTIEQEIGAIGICISLPPGQYIINYGGGEPRQFMVLVSQEWQSQVYLTIQPEPVWDTLRMHMERPGADLSEAASDLQWAELALDHMQISGFQFTEDELDKLLNGKFRHPLWGFIGLYSYLLGDGEVIEGRVQVVLRNMENRLLQLPDSGDLEVLKLLAMKRMGTLHEPLQPVDVLPLFKVGFDALVNLSSDYPGLLSDASLYNRIIMTRHPESPYVIWEGVRNEDSRTDRFKRYMSFQRMDKRVFYKGHERDLTADWFKQGQNSEKAIRDKGPERNWLHESIVDQLFTQANKSFNLLLPDISKNVGALPAQVRNALQELLDKDDLMDEVLEEQKQLVAPSAMVWAEREMKRVMTRLLAEEVALPDYPLTDYHAKYLAYALTRRLADNHSPEKLARAFADARIDPKPHQVAAALFGYRATLLDQGAILADEVGLGKTIEAGLVIAQKWAEGKKRILVIAPSSLRKQWQTELEEKFFLESTVLESGRYKELKKAFLAANPFEQDQIIISSYHFVRSKSEDISAIQWDLAVIDEAHRLRNAWKQDNVVGRAVKETLAGVPKLLLTATPLQNNIMELYGLISMLDEYAFGDARSFRKQYGRNRIKDEGQEEFSELKSRLNPYCFRTLRNEVQQYVHYTQRVALLQEYKASEQEWELYVKVSEYLRKDNLHALPKGQRHLITLIARKLLASSTFAITGTLESLIARLKAMAEGDETQATGIPSGMAADMPDTLDDLEEDWADMEAEEGEVDFELEPEEAHTIEEEIEELEGYLALAQSITEHTKANALLSGLKTAFEKAHDLGAKRKALIFTESTRTQRFLYDFLRENGFEHSVITYNGTNNEEHSRAIYQRWKTANEGTGRITKSGTVDRRTAILDEFAAPHTTILIATEAGSEGINMQFCSLVVNYDLPWNPQRVEQRIGRCHRYGQQHDVVVLNFLNQRNAADKRVFELLRDKFQLFEGLFGASDEVLGSIASGMDIEKQIARIYQECRTHEEIEAQFNTLRDALSEEINTEMRNVHQKLISNFDDQVLERLRLPDIDKQSAEYLNRYERWLWKLTKHLLSGKARFESNRHAFQLVDASVLPAGVETVDYHLKGSDSKGVLYRPGHPFAAKLIQEAKAKTLPPAHISFDLSRHRGNVAVLDELKGQRGYLRLTQVTIESYQDSDHLLFSGYTDAGKALNEEQCERLFTIPSNLLESDIFLNGQREKLSEIKEGQKESLNIQLDERDTEILKEQSLKLEQWAADQKLSLQKQIDDHVKKEKDLIGQVKDAKDKDALLELNEELAKIRKELRNMRLEVFGKEDAIEDKQKGLINEINERLKQHLTEEELFSIRWEVV